ncbi:uncharacterized protein [Chelonus insularis]|uniref:uncharacterized protein isoform X2 n=1 Tax=Chelonus insularis TaxID=460826 RepID=UPI00158D2226|nr:uncharacterized protein LOC118072678 isoform X2 [Chelonus insularis]
MTEVHMPITGRILVAGGAARCLHSAAGMLRFLARLSGRRRHVRRSYGAPGITTSGALIHGPDQLPSLSPPLEIQEKNQLKLDNPQLTLDPRRGSDDSLDDVRLRQCYLICRRQAQESRHQQVTESKSEDRLQNVEMPEDSLSRITGLRNSTTTTTITTTRHSHQRGQEEHLSDNSRVANRTSSCRQEQSSGSTGVARFHRRRRIPSYLATLLVLSYTFFGIADACSSRSTPKPRPPTSTPRPSTVTYQQTVCPPDYAEWYCLNGATCFTVKIQESLLYNCLCAHGFVGQRCEFKDLDGSYLPFRRRVMLETASIAGGATIAVFLVVIICIAAYIHYKRKQKELRTSTCVDTVDGPGRTPELRPFSNRNRFLKNFMAKNSNCSLTMCPSIQPTRMPGWNDYSQVELTRLASINEAKRSSQ